jgi:hypothetical protein
MWLRRRRSSVLTAGLLFRVLSGSAGLALGHPH